VGFGRWRLAWTRSGTEYVVAWIPLGGFVKMLGEISDDDQPPEVPDAKPGETLRAKPLWQKLAILFAGPAMNLLLPVVIFVVLLAVGLPRPEPVVGLVETGSPAARAGLRPGDRIVAVDGAPAAWWDAVEDDLRTRPGQDVSIRFERDGKVETTQLDLGARSGLNEFGGVHEIGWSGLGHARLRAVVGVPESTAPAALSGLRSGDRITAVGGVGVDDWEQLAQRYAAAGSAGSGVPLTVARGPADASETSIVNVPAKGSLEALGVVPASVLISRVSPDSPAEKAGLAPGDLLLTVDGASIGSFASFAELVRSSGGRTLQLTYARDGETRSIAIQPSMREADNGLGIPEPRYLIGIEAAGATLPGVMGSDVERNPLRSIPRAVGMTYDVTKTFLAGLGKLLTGEVSHKQLSGPIGIAEIAHKAIERGFEAYLSMLVLISINLGVLNLLPIPVLDGGQALLFTIEGIKRSPVSLRTREIVQQLGVTVLVLLMGLAFWNDLSRHLAKHWTTLLGWLRTSAGL
jgi:regulator of sigma E protease